MTNPEYNICLIYKDPVTANEGAFSPPLTPDTSSAAFEQKIMTYGLKVPKQGPLRNKTYVMVDPAAASPQSGGSWKFPYQGDTNHYLAQVQVFYWLNRQLTYMKERTGRFYAEDKGFPVLAFDPNLERARFSGTEILFGYRKSTLGRGDVGLDAAVVAHEAGHSNFAKALRSPGSPARCPNKDGCIGGIHEGQADVHAFLLFHDKGSALANYLSNSSEGGRDPASIKKKALTAQQLFDRQGGETHDMGEVYASVWWEVWDKYQRDQSRRLIEIIFTNHLGGMDGADTFSTALEVIREMAKQVAPQQATQIIADFETEYTRLGVTIP